MSHGKFVAEVTLRKEYRGCRRLYSTCGDDGEDFRKTVLHILPARDPQTDSAVERRLFVLA